MNDIRGLILAAGSSQRLRPLTDEVPKTLLRLNGRTILSHIVVCCTAAGLQRLTVVTGHGRERVEEECGRLRALSPALEFSYIHCPEYGSMGNVYSLYLARELFSQPLVLINSDLVFAREILSNLLSSPFENALVVDDCKRLGAEEMKVAVRNGLVTSIDKNLDLDQADGEYIGMTKISPANGEALASSLRYVVDSAPGKYYEDAFGHAISEGKMDFHKVSTGGAPCMEVDTLEDLALARENAHLWV